jgi:hypothetical protein
LVSVAARSISGMILFVGVEVARFADPHHVESVRITVVMVPVGNALGVAVLAVVGARDLANLYRRLNGVVRSFLLA